jgi:hypothetical protein
MIFRSCTLQESFRRRLGCQVFSKPRLKRLSTWKNPGGRPLARLTERFFMFTLVGREVIARLRDKKA